jgi:predicted metal-dependent HD superfamily phosphohydrolase
VGQAGITTELRDRWRALVSPWGASPAEVDAAFDEVIARYSEPHRRYHTVEHLTETLALVDGGAVELAVWFHDVIYDTTSSDNEARSADHAATMLARLNAPDEVVAEVRRLVLLTAGHVVDDLDADGELLVAADLSILSSDATRYDRYTRDVRAEYAHVDDASWREGRTAVLESLLAVVSTEQARSNIRRELDRLASPQP